jgi:hypothetical protein
MRRAFAIGRYFSVVAAIGLCLAAPAPAQKLRGPAVVLLDGTRIEAPALEIAQGRVTGPGLPAQLTFDDLRQIELPVPPVNPPTSPVLVVLRGSGRVQAESLTIAEDRCELRFSGQAVPLPLDLVYIVRFEPATASPEFEQAVATPLVELDRAAVKDENGKLTLIAGLIDRLTGQELALEVAGQVRTIPRSRLFGLLVAQPAGEGPPPRVLVAFRDGSTLGGTDLSLAEGKATLVLPAGGRVPFDGSAVRRVTIRSSRVAFLSDWKPTAEAQQAIVTFPLPWQRDKSASGKPLVVGTRQFEKGLGMHARTELTFALDKQWDLLAATIGLDPEAGARGDCVFTVLADGELLFTRRMRGSDSPYELELPLIGRGQLTLAVEPGEGLDLADYANWGDVRVVKNRR